MHEIKFLVTANLAALATTFAIIWTFIGFWGVHAIWNAGRQVSRLRETIKKKNFASNSGHADWELNYI